MITNTHLETVNWLNKRIEDIHAKSVLVGDLLMEEEDPDVIQKYDNKLAELENELYHINLKIEHEIKELEKLKRLPKNK